MVKNYGLQFKLHKNLLFCVAEIATLKNGLVLVPRRV